MGTTSELSAACRTVLDAVRPGARVLCAVSGGLDSMCLLHWMAHWGRKAGFEVCAAHFNHGLRSTADRDERFVRDQCRRWSIPLTAGRGDAAAEAARAGLSTEEAARNLRYGFLKETGDRERCSAILTAHHADDNAETMLLNLIRGTGLRGLCGIPRQRDGIVRPFLEISRAQLADYAAAHHIPHVEDETNADPEAAARNLLRLQVMPLLRQINPAAVENMTRCAGILTREEQALEQMARSLAAQAKEEPGTVVIPCAVLAQAPPGVAERAALLLLERAAGHRKDLTAAHGAAVTALARAPRPGGQAVLPYGITARRGKYALYLERRLPVPEAVSIAPGQTVRFGDWTVSLNRNGPGKTGWPMALPEEPLCVTAWRSADRLTLPGSRGSRSVKRLCVDRGIPPFERDALPVLRVGNQPGAVARLGVDCAFAPSEDHETVFITFMKETEENKYEK